MTRAVSKKQATQKKAPKTSKKTEDPTPTIPADADHLHDEEWLAQQREALNRSLEIDPGAQGEPYFAFRDRPFRELLRPARTS